MLLMKTCSRFKLVVIYERDPCGIRAGSDGIRRDPGSVVELKSCSRLKLAAIHARDPNGIRAGSDGIRRDPEKICFGPRACRNLRTGSARDPHGIPHDPTGSEERGFVEIKLPREACRHE